MGSNTLDAGFSSGALAVRWRRQARAQVLRAQLTAVNWYDRVSQTKISPPDSWVAQNACAALGLSVDVEQGPNMDHSVIVVEESIAALFAVLTTVPTAHVAWLPRGNSHLDRALSRFLKHRWIDVPDSAKELLSLAEERTVVVSRSIAAELRITHYARCVYAEVTMPTPRNPAGAICLRFVPLASEAEVA